MFALLDMLYVLDWVRVVTSLGTGRNVVANCTAEVGQSGEVLVAVIAVGGTGCIGAYFVRPVCKLYGVAHAPSPTDPVAAFETTLLTVGGPEVPETALTAAATVASNVPVMPVSVNRLE